MWELDHKESWAPKNWYFWTVVLEKTLESPLDCKEIQPVKPKGNQSWIFIRRTDAEAGTLILWPPDVKNWLIRKDPDSGKDWRWEEKGPTEDEMVGWHHWLNARVWANSRSCWWTGKPGHRVPKRKTWLRDWTESLKKGWKIGGCFVLGVFLFFFPCFLFLLPFYNIIPSTNVS